MSGKHFFQFEKGTTKSGIAFPQNGTGTGKPKQMSCSLGQEQENQNVIPKIWDGNGNYQISFPTFGTERVNMKVAQNTVMLVIFVNRY